MSLKRHDRGTVQTDGPGTGAHKCSASTIFASAVVDPCVDDGVDTLALDRQECLAVRIHQVFATALDQFCDQCILAGEILLERADADAGRIGDARGARRFEPLVQTASLPLRGSRRPSSQSDFGAAGV